MDNSWLEFAHSAVDYGIIGILVIMSVVSLWLFIERLMAYGAVRIGDYETKEELELDLGDNVSTIATIGSNAPYVGLLGTVLGIMITFYSLGDVGAVDPKKIMTGLALALKATAMGLVVAIPSIIFYNILLRKMERILTLWDINAHSKRG
ncbi:MAG: TonB-system energizer ExbB [Sulfuricurvum sp. RIFOXYD2_FULL_44_160]|uniref:TonB-system energizer ExbB n=1 Tax=Sulfuricurvum kujiense TaxID=148813 RepID=A0A2D3W9R0_9BACT|nr:MULTISPECIES: TonB-system energizer ExbB [Sulfuricurvum]OHD92745.1 MAG: TonB-system energizer ExbB [Sulfuricurvum sp. RIFOXYD12_FULL_44_77]OHD92827.1 MAG: TonB-system energizer ExbB [Sulfuricurvum sp. RIFOXYD2_FULL_44_160]DAB38062.1 MAG TPA: TonB-system energizer ExbB [Sulfuricurvum kujiense]